MTDSERDQLARVYEHLDQIRAMERQIRRKQLQRDELQSCLLPRAIRYDQDKVQTSPEDAMAETAAAVLDLDREIEQLRRKKAGMIRDIVRTIETLDDDREKLVLTAYYISRMPIRRIAYEIHYSTTQTYRLYRSGLLHLAERWGTWNSGPCYTDSVTFQAGE